MIKPVHKQHIPVDFDPFAGPEIEQVAPMTEPQAELWVACHLGGDDANRAYNLTVSLRFTGALDRHALTEALQALVQRHQALRSAFSGDGSAMLVFRDRGLPLDFADLSANEPAGRQAAIDEAIAADARHVFDLRNGPLVRTRLLKLTEEEHLFFFSAHHIVCDGWSIGIALQDLGALYSARVRGVAPDLPPAEQIGTYALEQRQFEQTADYKAVEQYWLDQFKTNPPPLDLPTDFPRPARRTYTGRRNEYKLDDDLTRALRKLGQQAGCSFVTTLLVSFEVLLHRLTGQTDLVVGLPAAGQPTTDRQRLVGHCVNLLPIRSRPQPQESFIHYLKSRREPILDAFDHQRLTFGSLLKKLSLPRDPARVPLVPVLFNVDFGMEEGVHFDGLRFEFANNPRQFEAVDLFVNAGGTQQSLTFEWSYNTQLFRPETIDGFMAQFVQLLRTIIADPTNSLGHQAVPPVSTRVPPPDKTSNALTQPGPALHELLARTAVSFADKTALEGNGQSLSFGELHGQANRLAHALGQRGIGPGSVVGVMLDRSPDMVIALLAVLKAGAAYLPLDPLYPHDRLAYMLSDAAAGLLITSARYSGRLAGTTPELRIADALGNEALPRHAPDVPVSGDALAYVLYTSGSTGKPKGVLVEHRNLVNLLSSMLDWPGITSSDKLLAVTTISFDIAGLELFLPLLVGATLVLADSNTIIDGRLLLDAARQPGISFIQATPATYKLLLEAGWNDRLPLKVLCCGEPLAYDLAQKIMARADSLWNMYGPTETTIYSTGKQILPTDKVITIGRPIAQTQVYLFDPAGQPVAPGSEGELYIGGAGVARGYLNRSELTAQKFVRHPLGNGVLYRTGDLCRQLPDGEILCLGRIDQQVKIRGYRIELGEVETTLNNLNNIKEAVVLAHTDRPGEPQLVAYVLVAGDTDVDPTQVSRWKQQARQTLPDYMIPAHFVVMPAFPLTPNGKIDRKALAAQPLNGKATTPSAPKPLKPEEQMLLRIWTSVLDRESIGLQDSFFDMGGHSMLALQAMVRLEKELGLRLPLATLFEHPTIESLAKLLRSGKAADRPKSLVSIKPYGTKTPVYIVHGGGLNLLTFRGLVEHMDAEQPIYGFQARGLDGTEEPLDSMDAIAADYIEELCEQNPDGPYALAGYSFGGYIALEMARQLTAAGKQVKMLGMFDTNAEESAEVRPFLSRIAWRMGRQLPKMAWIGRSLIEQPIPTLRYQGEYVERQVKNALRAMGLAQESTYSEIQDENLLRIIQKHEVAFNNYRMRPYDGVIDVFKARKRLYFVEDRQYLGWKKYARQGVRVHSVPGDHKEMLLPPNDKEFARILQQALDAS